MFLDGCKGSEGLRTKLLAISHITGSHTCSDDKIVGNSKYTLALMESEYKIEIHWICTNNHLREQNRTYTNTTEAGNELCCSVKTIGLYRLDFLHQ